MNSIKVAICDDFKDLLDTYVEQFKFYNEIEVVGTAQNGEECINMIKDCDVDVLLLDISIGSVIEGIELIPKILEIDSGIKIIMLTNFEDDDYVYMSFLHGASNYIVKSQMFDAIVNKIVSTYNGDNSIDYHINKKLVNTAKKYEQNQKSVMCFLSQIIRLTTSEFNILKDIYEGKSYKQISRENFIEEGTVRVHVSNILKKLNYTSMKKLIAMLRKINLFNYIE